MLNSYLFATRRVRIDHDYFIVLVTHCYKLNLQSPKIKELIPESSNLSYECERPVWCSVERVIKHDKMVPVLTCPYQYIKYTGIGCTSYQKIDIKLVLVTIKPK